ncbi:hypothetical protein PHMEG_00010784 [Phytophthora megakarya]|uniref:Aspartic protease n=1 Tax=Phytophthora megakarya TaxID=4795 RepID=A0A225WCV5_9STRA|nr:hypothetical protein PHMEG_00010784 [Phytophthora megakarya]
MNLDLARRLKLKLRTHRQIKVSDLGGITLGWNVVYVLKIWVGNIGEGVDVLLGMNFMYSASVRLCIREGLVNLPDEETVVMYYAYPKSCGIDLPVCPDESTHLRPGQEDIVRIRYDQSNPQRELVWAGRGKNWTAVKVVNISDQNVWIDTRIVVARIVEYGQFPGQPGFVRPGKAWYKMYRFTSGDDAAERLEQILKEREPPCTRTQKYQWSTKSLMRPHPQAAEERPKPLGMTFKVTRISVVVMKTVGAHSDPGPAFKVPGLENAADAEDSVLVEEEPVDAQSQTSDSTPVQSLEPEYARMMQVSAEELDLEPALRDQLIMLPAIEEPTPECNIDEANVGVPGVTTPEM